MPSDSKKIPKTMLVIGGGVIGLEFATVYTRMGAKVLVVEQLPQLLTGTDLEISKTMARILKKQGVEIALGTKARVARKKRRRRQGTSSTASSRAAKTKRASSTWRSSRSAAGPSPITSTSRRRASARTNAASSPSTRSGARSVDGIFAIGDVTGAPLLAHKAMKEGVVAAEVIAGDPSSAFDPVAIPNCVYTDPEVATVGLSEEEAKAAGYEVRIGKFPLLASGRARTMNESDGLIKLVGDAKTDLLLGMHIVAPQAESLIGEGVIALEMGATLEDIGLSIHPHPTLTESIMDAAEASHGQSDPHRQSQAEDAGRRGSVTTNVRSTTCALLDLGRRPYRETLALQRDLHARVSRGEAPPNVDRRRTRSRHHARPQRARPRTCCSRARRWPRAASISSTSNAAATRPITGRDKSSSIRFVKLERFREVVPLVRALERGRRRHRRDVRHRGASAASIAASTSATTQICAIGLAVKAMTSLHGLALNASTALDYDRLITPCGTPEFGITSISRELGRDGRLERGARRAPTRARRRIRRLVRAVKSRRWTLRLDATKIEA